MKVVWITGGGTGIGKALAELFYQEGYHVALSGRRADVLQKTAQEIGKAGGPGEIFAIPGDISSPAYVERAHLTITQLWGPVHILINNAAVNPHKKFLESTLEDYQKVLEINTLGSIYCAKLVAPEMIHYGSGAIINISSFLGKWSSAHSSAYCVSKFALAGFTDALRLELGPKGIHVMGVYPGFIRTPMTESFTTSAFKRWLAATPESMARAIRKGLSRRSRDVYYPGYVRALLLLHPWFPGPLERLYSRAR